MSARPGPVRAEEGEGKGGEPGDWQQGRREETLQLDDLALEPGAEEQQKQVLTAAAAAAAAAAADEEERLRERSRQLELEERERDRRRALDLEEEERRLAAEAAAAAAAAAALEEQQQRERERRRQEEEEERLAQAAAVAAAASAAALEQEQRRERERKKQEERLAAQAAAAAAAKAAAEEERASRVREQRLQQQMHAQQEADEARLAAERDREAQAARRLAAATKAEAEQQQQEEERKRRRQGPPSGSRRDELAPQPSTPVRSGGGGHPDVLSPPSRQAAVPAGTAAAGNSSRDSAREEAWAAARMLAEEKARVQAVRDAALRAGDKHQDSGAAGGGGGTVGGATTPTAAPSGERGVAFGERDSSSSRPGSVTLDAVVEDGGADDATRQAVGISELDVSGGGWRGFFSGRRQDGAGGGSATSSVSGSQVGGYGISMFFFFVLFLALFVPGYHLSFESRRFSSTRGSGGKVGGPRCLCHCVGICLVAWTLAVNELLLSQISLPFREETAFKTVVYTTRQPHDGPVLLLCPPYVQVSTAVDPALSILPEAGGVAPSALTNSRPWGPHDFQRVRKQRKPRGTAGGVANDPPPPPSECAACLGLWDAGGSALNRWYRCRRCGGTVHGACRQFFEAGETCEEPGDESGGAPDEDGMLARPVGWRDPVNRAGVVQVSRESVHAFFQASRGFYPIGIVVCLGVCWRPQFILLMASLLSVVVVLHSTSRFAVLLRRCGLLEIESIPTARTNPAVRWEYCRPLICP